MNAQAGANTPDWLHHPATQLGQASTDVLEKKMTEFEARMTRRIAALEKVEAGELRPFQALLEYRKLTRAMRYDLDALVAHPREEHR